MANQLYKSTAPRRGWFRKNAHPYQPAVDRPKRLTAFEWAVILLFAGGVLGSVVMIARGFKNPPQPETLEMARTPVRTTQEWLERERRKDQESLNE